MVNEFLMPGQMVAHPTEKDWGVGQVQSVIGNKITVNFPEQGKIVVQGDQVELVLIYD